MGLKYEPASELLHILNPQSSTPRKLSKHGQRSCLQSALRTRPERIDPRKQRDAALDQFLVEELGQGTRASGVVLCYPALRQSKLTEQEGNAGGPGGG